MGNKQKKMQQEKESMTKNETDDTEGLTSGESVTYMCLPCSITASCVSSQNHTTASLTFSKVVLTAEETRVYQVPWEKQQKKIYKSKQKSLCYCWCCVCTCLCKPVNNRLSRRVSMSSHDMKRRTACYKQLVEQSKPSIEQLQKWSVDFEDLLHNELGRKLFYLFLQQEHSEENLQFWNEVNSLKDSPDENDKTNKMRAIYKEFVKPMALKEVNIAGHTRRQIEESMETKPDEKMFDGAQQQVFLMMHRQSYPRFLQSEMFHAVMQATYAYNPNSPKPNVTGGSGSVGGGKGGGSSSMPIIIQQSISSSSKSNTENKSEHSTEQETPADLQLKPPTRGSEVTPTPLLSPIQIYNSASTTKLDRHNSMPVKSAGVDRMRSNNKLAARNSNNI